ncbi:MAG: DNA-directed RNA polymerase-3 subunit RPC5 [Bacillariaceae sp.]|jgi:DNA-directed RNA polymerase-3 subunit RPC5
MSRRTKIKSEPEVVMDLDDSDDNIDKPIAVTSNNVIGVLDDDDSNSSSNNNDNEIDDDDEIVREIPVFLSPELSKQIQLIQYPLQKHAHPSPPEAARVKPRHCMMEIDFDTPTNIQRNGLYTMASRTFTSHTIPVSTHMALGKMMVSGGGDDNDPKQLGLHLVPLSRMTQMRPSFSHVDEAVASASATTDEELKRLSQLQSDPSGGTGRKSISFQKKESERQALARKSSYGFKKASEDSEGWHSLEVYDEKTLQANLIMNKVACPLTHQSRNLFDAKTLEKESGQTIQTTATITSNNNNNDSDGGREAMNAKYLNTLNYLPPREDFENNNNNGNDTTSISAAATAAANDDDEQKQLTRIVTKLVRLMHQGRPIPYSLLRAQFSTDDVTDETLFVALGSCATLVRGNFCLNSKLLSYPPAMAQARTFLLCLFQSMRVVHRERLMRVFVAAETTHPDNNNNNDGDDVVTTEVIGFLLEQVGKKSKEGWVLKVDDDLTFAEKNPQTTVTHLQYWAKQIELFTPMLLRYRSNPFTYGDDDDDDDAVMDDS